MEHGLVAVGSYLNQLEPIGVGRRKSPRPTRRQALDIGTAIEERHRRVAEALGSASGVGFDLRVWARMLTAMAPFEILRAASADLGAGWPRWAPLELFGLDQLEAGEQLDVVAQRLRMRHDEGAWPSALIDQVAIVAAQHKRVGEAMLTDARNAFQSSLLR